MSICVYIIHETIATVPIVVDEKDINFTKTVTAVESLNLKEIKKQEKGGSPAIINYITPFLRASIALP